MIATLVAATLASFAHDSDGLAGLAGVTLETTSEDSPSQSRLRRGRHELSVHVSPDFEGPVGDTLFFEGGYGVFVRDSLLVRGTLEVALLEDVVGPDDDYRTQAFGVAAEYHWLTKSRVVPYVGLDLAWRRTKAGSTDESGVAWGPRVGAKCFLAADVVLDFTVTYQLSSADVFLNDFVLEDTDLAGSLGLRVLL